MEQISIEQVSDRINATIDPSTSELRQFGIRYLSEKGNTPEVRVRKLTKGAYQKTTGQDKRGKGFYNLQANGIMLLENLDAERPESVKLAMIFAFRDHNSKHWQTVFH